MTRDWGLAGEEEVAHGRSKVYEFMNAANQRQLPGASSRSKSATGPTWERNQIEIKATLCAQWLPFDDNSVKLLSECEGTISKVIRLDGI